MPTMQEFTIQITISQPELIVNGVVMEDVTQTEVITFGKWFKGDKGDKGDTGTARTGTTAFWNAQTGFVPEDGEIIVYTDKSTKFVDGQAVYVPGVKIGTGNAYVQDLAFVADDIADSLLSHINDLVAHVTQEDRNKWNNKLNISDVTEVVGETLIFNRN